MTVFEILADGSPVAAVGEPDDDGRLPVHGVILGEGDVTNGLSGKRTRWPGDVLEQMADENLFESKPITMADSLDPEQHVGVELTDDGPMLTGAVSIDEKVGEVSETVYEDGVGLLFDGFIADWEAEDVVESGLAQVSPVVMRDLELVEGDPDENTALYEPSEVQAARDLALVADGAAPSNDINVGSLETDPSVAEALATHFGTDADALTDHRGGDDGPQGNSGQSTPADDDTPTMDLTDKEQELVAAARQKDDPTVVEAEVRDQLDELEAQIDEHEEVIAAAEAVDDPEVMDADEAEAMQERVAIVENLMAEALQERNGLKESTVEAMSFDAMAAEFEADDGLDVEALTQTPETGSGPATGGSGGGVTDEDRERIQEIDQKLDALGSALPDSRIEALQEEAADLAGADDYAGALEVL